MKIQTLSCLKLSTAFPTMSCLSAILIQSWKPSAVPRKTALVQCSEIFSHLNLTYVNNDEHTHLDRAECSTDILDVAFISPNITKHDIQFLIGDDLGSDHLPIEISVDAQPHRNTHTNPLGINLTRLTEKCSNQLSRRH